ncbi:Vesicle-associated protein 1-1 [Trichinella zimbabwensis]|uniref:Major sperm protein n=2 Tax=Trichinella TaxID=6333 RepID=A0A0V1N544_9BILA|nr:Vesicle-associated protein 1-1 [Trichinella zimbabwensis]KRZ78901.1 Vesicle-associated protein 1-1 [Trichinella papuae]
MEKQKSTDNIFSKFGCALRLNEKEQESVLDQLLLTVNALKIRPTAYVDHISQLCISNPTAETVSFKIKTSRPRLLTVKPSCGFLLPTGMCKVLMRLQDSSNIPPEVQRDCIRITFMVIPDGVVSVKASTVWQEMRNKEPVIRRMGIILPYGKETFLHVLMHTDLDKDAAFLDDENDSTNEEEVQPKQNSE